MNPEAGLAESLFPDFVFDIDGLPDDFSQFMREEDFRNDAMTPQMPLSELLDCFGDDNKDPSEALMQWDRLCTSAPSTPTVQEPSCDHCPPATVASPIPLQDDWKAAPFTIKACRPVFKSEKAGSPKSGLSERLSRTRANPMKMVGRRTGHSSPYRGVSHHRLTQRWEASLWLEGKQIYLGGFDTEIDAAHAYDVAAFACKRSNVSTNFPREVYAEQLEQLKHKPKEEVVALVRRNSSAFSRGRSLYRGVSGEEHRWEARVGAFRGRKNVSLGIYSDEEEAAHAYDRALIIERGRSAKTNFALSFYDDEVRDAINYVNTAANSNDPAGVISYNTCVLPLQTGNGSSLLASPKPRAASERAHKGGRPRNICPIHILLKDLDHALSPRTKGPLSRDA